MASRTQSRQEKDDPRQYGSFWNYAPGWIKWLIIAFNLLVLLTGGIYMFTPYPYYPWNRSRPTVMGRVFCGIIAGVFWPAILPSLLRGEGDKLFGNE